MDFKPKKFGKFMLLDKIASGGMAEIFMARMGGPGGFEKIVALKRILPHLSANKEFISMFIDEARTTSQLTHGNIAQIYDFGHVKSKTQDNYYLAMEYVDGKNLRQILARCEEIKRPIPIEHAVYVVSKICEGLDYAHRFREKRAQESLQIIHRDISPQNVLVSYEGEIKLIDFGIAKTRAKADKSRPGILKGKFGYMSPEQAQGETVDQRTDLFSAGIILFEILTRQRLFQSNNDLNVLKKVQEAKIPAPSLFNPDIPFELEEIVLKALEKDRHKRYQTARQFHQALSRFLNTLNPDFTSSHTSAFIRSLFALDILDHKKKMNEILISLTPFEPPVEVTETKTKPHRPGEKAARDAQKTVTAVKPPETISEEMPVEMPELAQLEPPSFSSRTLWLQISLMGAAVLILSFLLLVLNQEPERIIQSSLLLERPQPGSEERVPSEKRGPGAEPKENSLTIPHRDITKSPVPAGVGFLNIKTVPESDIEIDGKPVGRSPIDRYPLSAGQHKVKAINKELGLSAEKSIDIAKDEIELLDENDLVFRPIPKE